MYTNIFSAFVVVLVLCLSLLLKYMYKNTIHIFFETLFKITIRLRFDLPSDILSLGIISVLARSVRPLCLLFICFGL